jgi:hypothetical protein
LVLVMLVLAVSYASSARAWLRQRHEISDLSAQITAQRAAVKELQKSQRRWHDPAYIEEQARKRFGWVMPGETGYRVLDADGNLLSDGSSTLSAPVTPTAADPGPWWQQEWATVIQAGQTPADIAAAKRAEPHPPRQIGAHSGAADTGR